MTAFRCREHYDVPVDSRGRGCHRCVEWRERKRNQRKPAKPQLHYEPVDYRIANTLIERTNP